jgi:hypothetical protein
MTVTAERRFPVRQAVPRVPLVKEMSLECASVKGTGVVSGSEGYGWSGIKGGKM